LLHSRPFAAAKKDVSPLSKETGESEQPKNPMGQGLPKKKAIHGAWAIILNDE